VSSTLCAASVKVNANFFPSSAELTVFKAVNLIASATVTGLLDWKSTATYAFSKFYLALSAAGTALSHNVAASVATFVAYNANASSLTFVAIKRFLLAFSASPLAFKSISLALK